MADQDNTLRLADVTLAIEPPPPAGLAKASSKPPPLPSEARTRGERLVAPPPPSTAAPPAVEGTTSTLATDLVAQAQAAVADYEAELKTEPQGNRRGQLHCEIARLHERPLANFKFAERQYRLALDQLPEHAASRHGLRRTLYQQGRFSDALKELTTELAAATNPKARASLAFQRAMLLELELSRPKDALDAYEQVLTSDPTHAPALDAIARLARTTGDLNRAQRALSGLAKIGPPREQAATLCSRARALELAGNEPAAIDTYEKATTVDPGCGAGRDALQRLLPKTKRVERLIEIVRNEAQDCPPGARKVALMSYLGHAQAALLGRPEDANVTLAAAHAMAPNDGQVLASLTRLSRGDNPRRLLEYLEARAAVEPSEATRAATFVRMGRLCQTELGDDVGARRWYESALEINPRERRALQGLETIHTRWGDDDALIKLWTTRAGAESVTGERVGWLRKASNLLQARGRVAEAASYYREALSLDPGDPTLFFGLERIHMEAQDHEGLAALYKTITDDPTATPERRVDLLFRTGQLEEGPLGRPERALDTYARVLILDPSHSAAAWALESAARRAQEFEILAQCLFQQAQHKREPGLRAELMFRSAEVLGRDLNDAPAAEARYREALTAEPKHWPSLFALDAMHRQAGNAEGVLEVGERQLDLLEDGRQRAELLLDLAHIAQEDLADPQAALALARRAHAASPDNLHTDSAVDEALQDADGYQELAARWKARLEATDDPRHRAVDEFRLGQLYELQLAAPKAATKCYEAAVGCDPSMEAAWEGLCRTTAALGRERELADVLWRRAQFASEPYTRNRMSLHAAWLYAGRLKQPDRALACLEHCDPPDTQPPDALRLLTELAQSVRAHALADAARWAAASAQHSGQTRVLALWDIERARRRDMEPRKSPRGERREVLEQLRMLAPEDPAVIEAQLDDAMRGGDLESMLRIDTEISRLPHATTAAAEATVRVAEALERSHPGDAAESYLKALALDGTSVGAARGLARIATGHGDAQLLEQAAEWERRTGGRSQTVAALFEHAGTSWQQSGQLQEAAHAYEQALRHAPDSLPLADLLAQQLSHSEDHARLVDALRSAAHRAQIPEARCSLWLRISELQEKHLDNVPGALAAAKQALQLAPNSLEALLRIAGLRRNNRQWDEAITLLKRAVATARKDNEAESGGEALRIQAFIQMAQLYEERNDDPGRAISCLQAADAIDGQRTDVLTPLVRLHLQSGQTQAAQECALRLVDEAEGAQARAAAFVLLARARESGEPGPVIEALTSSVRLAGEQGPGGHPFRQYLKRHPKRTRDYVRALLAYATHADDSRATPTWLEVARVHDEIERDPGAARKALSEAIELHDDPELRLALGGLELAAGSAESALVQAQWVVDRQPHRAAAVRLWIDARRAQGALVEAARGAAVISVLGAATKIDQQLSLEHSGSDPGAPISVERVHAPAEMAQVSHAAEALLRLLRPALRRLYPVDLEGYGVGTGDRLRADHQFMQTAKSLAQRLGAGTFELYTHRTGKREARVELGDTPKVLVHASWAKAPLGLQCYVLTGPLLAIALGIEAIYKLTPRELHIVLASACRAVAKKAGEGLTDEDGLNRQAKQITKALTRRQRKELEERARSLLAAAQRGLDVWPNDRLQSLERVAAQLCGDLPALVQMHRDSHKGARELSPARLAEHDERVAGLLRLWLTDKPWQELMPGAVS